MVNEKLIQSEEIPVTYLVGLQSAIPNNSCFFFPSELKFGITSGASERMSVGGTSGTIQLLLGDHFDQQLLFRLDSADNSAA